MSRLLHLVESIRRKITDDEYKTVVDEIRRNETRHDEAHLLSKVKIAIPWVSKQLDGTDECGEDPITICHEFFTLIVPTTYLQQNKITPGCSYQITELFNNSLNYDSESFINRLETVVINSVQIQNRTCIVVAVESVHKNNESVDLAMEVVA
jgi:hypothetical protein